MASFKSLIRKRVTFILATVLFGLVVPLLTCSTCRESGKTYLIISFLTISLWLCMWLGNEYLNGYLSRRIPWTKQPMKRLIVGVLVMVAFTLSTTLLIAFGFEWIFTISLGNIGTMLYTTMLVTLVITLFMTSRSFLFNWRQMAINAEQHRRESISAKYENLKNQVNPHFLFNSLNALTNLVHEDPEKAVEFIKQLSDVYRYVLDTREWGLVPLAEELKFLRAYAYLQHIRFGEKLHIDIALHEEKLMVAPLSLQLLVENAIKHNVISEESPLHVVVYSEEDYIIVKNNLKKKVNPLEKSPGLGLENIKTRYAFLSDRKMIIVDNGEKFMVKLPFIYEIQSS
jgi:sensor histidine kinase YesM